MTTAVEENARVEGRPFLAFQLKITRDGDGHPPIDDDDFSEGAKDSAICPEPWGTDNGVD